MEWINKYLEEKEKTMKVLHLTSGIGISVLARALRMQGVNADSCSFNTNRYSYLADVKLNLTKFNLKEREVIRKKYLMEAMDKYDIFHFHFGETFFLDKSDLEILSAAGKKLIVHHRGSEVRKKSIARKFNNPYVETKNTWTEEKIHGNLMLLSKYIDQAIVSDYELLPYVKPYYQKIHIVPYAIDPDQIIPYYPVPNDNPVIVHAPSNRKVKGTKYILAAIERLKRKGMKFQFELIENLSHEEALQLYQKASIVIDQIQIGTYANLSMEAMAMGKPVICYIREDLRQKYPPELPIVNANPDTIYDTLKLLLKHPRRWKTLGRKGRYYIEKHHSLKRVGNQLISIYKNL